jgi:capsular exopolysaccharide synthesis family protein
MSTINPSRSFISRPTTVSTGPAAPSAQAAPATDPFRVLRKHLSVIAASAVLGIIVGIIVWVALRQFYPMYSSAAQFEIVAALKDATQTTTGDLDKEDTVIRLARTEAAFLISDGVLAAVVTHPEVRRTRWAQGLVKDGVFQTADAIEELQEDLKVTYLTDTNLFEARWSTHVPEDLPMLLNTVQDTYLAKRAELEDQKWGGDLQLFMTQEQTLQTDIDNINREIDEFVRTHNIYTLDQIPSHPIALEVNSINQTIASLNSSLSVLNTTLQQVVAKLEGEIEYSPEDRLVASQDPSIQQLTGAIVNMKVSLAAMDDTVSDQLQIYKQTQINLNAAERVKEQELQEVIKRNLNGTLKGLRNQLDQSTQLLQELEARQIEKDAEMVALAGKVSEYQSLTQKRDMSYGELEVVRTLVADLRRLRQRAAADRVQRFTQAVTPRQPSFPRPEVMIPLGFLLVVGGTVGFIFLRELTDKSVKSASDLAIVPGARVLGVVPDLQDDPTRINRAELALREEPRSVIAESYRQTCTPIVRAMERNGHQSLVVVGGMPGAGSTTVVTNLASFIASGGKRVVVIDGNFRRPTLAKAMNCAGGEGAGLGDLLAGKASLRETIVSCGGGVDLIGAGTPVNRVYERLSNGQIDSVLAELRTLYDFIVIDAPPAMVAGDAQVLANRTDASVLVVRAHQDQRGLVARLITQFSAAHSELIGVILNRPRWTAGGYFKKNFATMAEYSTKSAA